MQVIKKALPLWHHSPNNDAMYRKFEFAVQPFFSRRPAVIHPEYEIVYSGVMSIDIDGNREVEQLYIGGVEYYTRPANGDRTASMDWFNFREWLNETISGCDDSDESQAKIHLPPGNMYDEMYKKKPSGNARWFDPSELTAENAAQFAAIMGEVEAVGEGLVVTEFTKKTFN